MPRYVAFLRGVSPMNAKMPAVKQCFERAGFADVTTVLASGNVVFSAGSKSAHTLERTIEAATTKHLGRTFPTLVRSVAALEAMVARDPFAALPVPAKAKRVVTFLRQPPKPAPNLPVEADGARILALDGAEAFTAYMPSPRGPVFMTLIEDTFGSDVTTRTWDTVLKCTRR